jgi:hypothetical protein
MKPWGSFVVPSNSYCWAIYREAKSGARIIRKIVWGRLLARAEKRDGEKIAPAMIVTKA